MLKLDKIKSVQLRKDNLLEIVPTTVSANKEAMKSKRVKDMNLKCCIKVSIKSDNICNVSKFFLTQNVSIIKANQEELVRNNAKDQNTEININSTIDQIDNPDS